MPQNSDLFVETVANFAVDLHEFLTIISAISREHHSLLRDRDLAEAVRLLGDAAAALGRFCDKEGRA